MYAPLRSYFAFPNRDFNEHFKEKSILNLILYYPSPHENAMKDILTTYLSKLTTVQFYFITLRPQKEEVVIEDHVMYINGTETYRPGILDKTIRAIQ